VQSDKSGNILRMEGTNWWIAQEFDYEQRLTRVRAANGDIIVNEYDAMGARLKQIKTSGGTATETRMVYALGRLIQERDASDAVTARYFWGDVAAGNAQTVFKKDNGESAKYLVPEGRGSPLENLNKDGTLSGARAYDAFGVTNYSFGTTLTPFECYANLRLSGSQITLTGQGRPYYPEIGQNVDGGYRLTYFNGQGSACGGECGPVFELHPALPKKRGGGTLPLPYPPEGPGILPGQCRPGNVTAPIRTASLEMPSIGSLDFPCNWVFIPVRDPCGGGGPPGESSGCDYDNLVAGSPRESGDVTVTTAKGGPHSVNVCECTLRRKMCASQPDSDADSCNYKLDCGDKGSFDVYNTQVRELQAWMKKNCRGADNRRPCPPGPNCVDCCKDNFLLCLVELLGLGVLLALGTYLGGALVGFFTGSPVGKGWEGVLEGIEAAGAYVGIEDILTKGPGIFVVAQWFCILKAWRCYYDCFSGGDSLSRQLE
jgi:hypothetical protein